MPRIPITSYIAIDSDEIEEKFIRASGPGGQNVNNGYAFQRVDR